MIYWYYLAANAGLLDAQRDLGYAYFFYAQKALATQKQKII